MLYNIYLIIIIMVFYSLTKIYFKNRKFIDNLFSFLIF